MSRWRGSAASPPTWLVVWVTDPERTHRTPDKSLSALRLSAVAAISAVGAALPSAAVRRAASLTGYTLSACTASTAATATNLDRDSLSGYKAVSLSYRLRGRSYPVSSRRLILTPSDLSLSPIDKANAYEFVQRELLRVFVSGAVKVGDRLPSEKDMARQLGVSRPVVREALGSLRALGLVDSRKGRGSFVVLTTPSSLPKRFSMYDLFEARSLVEVPMARLAAHRGSREVIAAMTAAVDAMESASDGREWEEQDAVFHAAVARASGNIILVDLGRRIHRDILHDLGISLRSDSRVRQANSEHREICLAISAGDEERAAKAMAAHLSSVFDEAISIYGDEPLTGPR